MDNKSFKPQCSSTRLQKAISKNQTFENELKKELQQLEFKKKSHEKAFQQKRTQFLRRRLCLNHLLKSGNSIEDGSVEKHVKERPGISEFPDLKTSYSTGDLLESLLHSSRTPSPTRSKKQVYKLSLESSSGGLGSWKDEWKCSVHLNSNERTIEKSQYWEGNLSAKNPSKCLQVPSLPKFMTSRSEENLSKSSGNESSNLKSNVRVIQSEQTMTAKSNRLLVPRLDKRLSLSDECFVTRIERPRTANDTHEDTKMPRIERQHSFCGTSSNSETVKSTHLALPPLTRERRRKSMESVIRTDEQHSTMPRSRTLDNTDMKSSTKKLTPRKTKPPPSPRAEMELRSAPKSTSFGETTKKEIKAAREKSGSKERKLQKSSSTPELLDIGPEVEHLLMDDDKTRLQRMRAALHALRFASDVKDCRYLRNVETNQSSTAEIQPVQLPNISKNNSTEHKIAKQSNEEDVEVFEDVETEPAVIVASGEENREEISAQSGDCESENEPVKQQNESLSSSSSSTLAEMFQEIKNTRYLRMPGTPGHEDLEDDEEEDSFDIYKMSHGHNTPLIIVGHTKAVLMMDGDKLN